MYRIITVISYEIMSTSDGKEERKGNFPFFNYLIFRFNPNGGLAKLQDIASRMKLYLIPFSEFPRKEGLP